MLLVYALINRPYILDLRPDNSFVRHLLGRGYDVFLIDWGRPGWEDRGITLDELVGEHLPKAVERIARAGAGDDYTLFGYCMGGTMGVIHAALQPTGLRNLVALTTPIDFSRAGLHQVWTDPRHFDAAAVADALGNVSGSLIDLGNKLLKPGRQLRRGPHLDAGAPGAGKDMTAWRAMNQWVERRRPVPGRRLRPVDRGLLPAEPAGARRADHRPAGRCTSRPSPRRSSPSPGRRTTSSRRTMARPLNDLVASRDSEYLELPAGHVGLLAGSGARDLLWPKVTDWLDARSD